MPGDKLPAISGIAMKIRKATHSEYIAGLWKGNLAFDLLWQRVTPTPSDGDLHALETWRAPSFSWSSLNAPIIYDAPDDDEQKAPLPTIDVVSSTVIPSGLNALGTVSDAYLTLRGPTAPATLLGKHVRGAWEYTLVIKGTTLIKIAHDCCLVKAEAASGADGSQWTVRRAQHKQCLSEFEGPVLCLSVARHSDFISGIVLGHSEPAITTPCSTADAPALPSSAFDPPFSVSIPTEISSLVPTLSTEKPTALPSLAYGPEYSASIPTEVSTSVPAINTGVDQPNPSGTFTLPASLSFDPTKAPAFTLSLPISIITYGPSSSTPCSTEIIPTEAPEAPETPDASEAPEVPAVSTPCTEESETPVATAIPTKTPDASEVPEAPVSTPCTEEATKTPDATKAPEVPTVSATPTKSKARVTSTLTSVKTVTPKAPTGAAETPCSEEPQATATRAQAGIPALTPLPSEVPYPTASGASSPNAVRPSPNGGAHHSGRPGFGWGRPRPTGWGPRPNHGDSKPRPTGSVGPSPQGGSQPGKNEVPAGKASTTPCTLETRVRPTATGAAY
ncbi:hypothetical protein E8E13_003312 [Curvularia kusanoi]|uniref:Uncharacterized protein n=1 Tax=Curvularia kusanoi TaxID=90978 RepID=A0A9P4T8T2_CURKU|nr:hypothetical protein E8E13_003312 [Curvularia kusanoi]